MKILAIDPSLNGTAICAPNGITWNMPKTDLNGPERLSALRQALRDTLEAQKPDLVVLEDYSYGSKGRSVINIAEWGGVLRLTLHETGLTVALVPPTSLKAWATGKGNAGKAAVVSEVTLRAGRTFATDDQADAWALWAMASQAYGQPVCKMPADREKALQKVEWPKVEVKL